MNIPNTNIVVQHTAVLLICFILQDYSTILSINY